MTQHLQVFSELIQNISLFMLRDSNTHIQTQPKKKKNFLGSGNHTVPVISPALALL